MINIYNILEGKENFPLHILFPLRSQKREKMIYSAFHYSLKPKFSMTNFPQIFLDKSCSVSLVSPKNTMTVSSS